MLHRASLLPALGVLAASAVLATTAGPAAASAFPTSDRPATTARQPADTSPLSVTIDTISPSYIPRRGPVQVTGSVTNNDVAPWRQVQTYAFISAAPMRTSAELAAASATDPAADVGGRITESGTYDDLPRIDPGETVQFSIRVPRADLPATEPGVYWFGVHALGQGPDGRTGGADGRARTFLPLVAPTRRAVDTALVVPLRHAVLRTADGRLRDQRAWGRQLAPDGQLGTMVDFGTSAGDRPITWLVDPALTDAVGSLAAGNPPRSLGPSRPDRSGSHDNSSSPASPEPHPSASAGDGTSTARATASATTTAAAAAWLDRLKEGLRGTQVLALPYGDVDVAAASGSGPSLFRQAWARTGLMLRPLDLPVTHAVAPPNGFLDRAGLDLTPTPDTVLVSDRMLPAGSPTVVRTAGRRLVATSSGAASGGPGPDDPLGAVAVRQRILAEAAVRLLSPGPQQLAVQIPQTWAPSSSTGFFEGLDVGWLHLTTVAGLEHGPATPVPADQLVYPRAESRREVDSANFSAARSLMRTGRTLQDVLLNHTDVARQIADQAMPSTSYAIRRHPGRARALTERANAYVLRQLGSIGIEAPRGVTLSSASGRFAATVTNGLDQPVRVSVAAVSDGTLSISSRTLEIGADGSSTVLLGAVTRRPGIHNVTLRLVDSAGTPLGASDSLPIRSAEVSNVIWVILGTGVVLLFGAIAVRLVRRLRAAARAARQA